MAAPPGSIVSIYYDANETVYVGDALVTRTGRTYLIVALRRQAKGKHVGRLHLRAVVAEGSVPDDVQTHALHWYKRG